MFCESLFIEFAMPSKSPPDIFEARRRPASFSTAIPVVFDRSFIASAASIAFFAISARPPAVSVSPRPASADFA